MIDITSKDFEITEAIRTEIESMEASLKKHMGEDERVKVTLSKTAPDAFNVHMQTHYMGEDIIADHESHNFHKALELCREHLIKQVDKRRDKVKQR